MEVPPGSEVLAQLAPSSITEKVCGVGFDGAAVAILLRANGTKCPVRTLSSDPSSVMLPTPTNWPVSKGARTGSMRRDTSARRLPMQVAGKCTWNDPMYWWVSPAGWVKVGFSSG